MKKKSYRFKSGAQFSVQYLGLISWTIPIFWTGLISTWESIEVRLEKKRKEKQQLYVFIHSFDLPEDLHSNLSLTVQGFPKLVSRYGGFNPYIISFGNLKYRYIFKFSNLSKSDVHLQNIRQTGLNYQITSGLFEGPRIFNIFSLRQGILFTEYYVT